MHFLKTSISIVLVSAFLTACGGGGSESSPGGTSPGQTGNAFQGNWTATFTGGDEGACETIVIASNGNLSGSCTSRNIGGASIGVAGTVSNTGAAQFTAGGATSGATFSGTLATNGTGNGTWVNTIVSGTWTATKKN
jgi:hypothetical protein